MIEIDDFAPDGGGKAHAVLPYIQLVLDAGASQDKVLEQPPAFLPRMAKPLAGEDVFRRLDLRKTEGGK